MADLHSKVYLHQQRLNKQWIVLTSVLLAAVIIGVLLHFAPVASERGVINRSSSTCIAYSMPREYEYRIFLGELNAFNEEKSQLTTSDSPPCGELVDLKLYLW